MNDVRCWIKITCAHINHMQVLCTAQIEQENHLTSITRRSWNHWPIFDDVRFRARGYVCRYHYLELIQLSLTWVLCCWCFNRRNRNANAMLDFFSSLLVLLGLRWEWESICSLHCLHRSTTSTIVSKEVNKKWTQKDSSKKPSIHRNQYTIEFEKVKNGAPNRHFSSSPSALSSRPQ